MSYLMSTSIFRVKSDHICTTLLLFTKFCKYWNLLITLVDPLRANTALLTNLEIPITSSSASSSENFMSTLSATTSTTTPTFSSVPFGGSGLLLNGLNVADNSALLRPNLSHNEIRLPTKPLDLSEVVSCAITQPPPPIVTNVVAAANKFSSGNGSSSTVSLLRGIRLDWSKNRLTLKQS